jgi:hypothetical protein
MKATLHKSFKKDYGDGIASMKIISVVINGKEVFMENESLFDIRGTHYGHTQESWTLVTSPSQCAGYSQKNLGVIHVSPRAVHALLKCKTGSIFNGGHFDRPRYQRRSWYRWSPREQYR